MSNGGEFFGKYIGMLGVLAFLFALGYIVAPFADVTLPEGYTQIMLLLVGAYAGKNGSQIVSSARSKIGM